MATRKPMKIPRQHVERIIRYNGPPTPLIITCTPTPSRLQLSLCDPTWNPAQILHSTITSIYACFTKTRAHPDRILYIVTGLVFVADSPLPFGGPKTTPGYVQYIGSTPQDLLEYIVSSAYKAYWGYRGKTALEFIVQIMNQALDLHFQGDKEKLDELLLRGMKRSGHISSNRMAVIPEKLMHVAEVDNSFVATQVLFTPTYLVAKKKFFDEDKDVIHDNAASSSNRII
ncbi:UNVERIFIED_CONTAM: hypothetical protein HDU68_009492 [Siphonaria sp. JEL0065]|nr:hypothetical protein HDU68_009492 [Siphonaria sp. JEL0065]